MRENLFRAKRTDNKKWTEGILVKSSDADQGFGAIIIPTEKSNMFLCEKENNLGFEVWHPVIPETVCQYTGLTDKNGRKIFEGDILSAHLDDQYPEDITYVQITWDGFSWCTRESTEDDVMTEHDCNVFEVCGNVFDNPELIGGKECT